MKIALLADVFGQANNGTSVTALRLVENMRARGHKVIIISSDPAGEDRVQLPVRNFGILNNYIKHNGVELAKPDCEIIKNAIADCDVVHILLPFKTGQVGAKICTEMKKPFTTAFHCQPENFSSHLHMQWCRPLNSMLYRRYRRVLYKRARFIHCPSAFIAGQLVRHKYPGEKLVISNGVSSAFKPAPAQKPAELKDNICILFTGRYVGEKRHDVLIKAIKYSKYADKIQLILAGGGPKQKRLEKLGRRLKNPPIMRLFKQAELAGVINYCDLYVHPSDFEIEAIACIEAFSCGLIPVIADSVNSATHQFALTPENKFKRGNPKSLARRIDYWLDNPEKKAGLAQKYIEFGKQFNIESCMDRMEKMFMDCIEAFKKNNKYGR